MKQAQRATLGWLGDVLGPADQLLFLLTLGGNCVNSSVLWVCVQLSSKEPTALSSVHNSHPVWEAGTVGLEVKGRLPGSRDLGSGRECRPWSQPIPGSSPTQPTGIYHMGTKDPPMLLSLGLDGIIDLNY